MQTQTYTAVDSTGPQQAAIPVAFTPPPVFGVRLQAEQYEQSRHTQRERQSSEIAVAPRCSVTNITGRVVHAGEPITPQEVGGVLVIRELERAGVLIIIDAETAATRAAPPSRFRVAASATNTRRGIVGRGGSVTAADFATDAIPEVPARSAHVSDAGFPVPATPGYPGRPATDGKVELQELIARGVVVDTESTPKGKR